MKPLLPKHKYYPLQQRIKEMKQNGQTGFALTIGEIDRLLEDHGKSKLPSSAFKHGAFWGNDSNSHTHVWKPAWLTNQCTIEEVSNLNERNRSGTLCFIFK